MNSLLILGGSVPYAHAAKRAGHMGFRAIVADRNPQAPAAAAADTFYAVDITDREGILAVAKKEAVSGVLALNDYGVPTAAYVAEALGLPGVKPMVAESAISKRLMREAWRLHGVPSAGFVAVEDGGDAVRAAEAIGYPVIVKPACSIGGGCRGVSLVKDPTGLSGAVAFAREFYSDKTVLVEECLVGREFSVEVAIWRGVCHVLAIGENVKIAEPYRVNKQIIYPAALTAEEEAAASSAICQGIRALAIESGSVHVEFSLTEEGPRLIELGARCGGGGISGSVIESALGICVVEEAMRMAVGLPPKQLEPRWHKTTVYHFLTPGAGLLKAVHGIAEVRAHAGVEEVQIFKQPGQDISSLRTGLDRGGAVIVCHEREDEALRIARWADERIIFEYETETGLR